MLSKQSVLQASVIITTAALLSRTIGFIREIIIAKSFGASFEYDLFLVAATFPMFICNILLFTIPGTLIPLYSKETGSSENSAWTFAFNFLNVFGLFFLIIAGLISLAAPSIINIYAPSLGSPDRIKAILYLRILSSIVFTGGLFAILKSIFNANKHFILPAFAPLLLNTMIIFSILLLHGRISTLALVFGFSAGYLMQLVVCIPFIHVGGTKYRFSFPFKNDLIKMAYSSFLFIALIETISQLTVVIDRSFIGSLPEGGISALNYANTIAQIPIGVFGIALGTAVFPSASDYANQENWPGLKSLLIKSLKSIFIVIVPLVSLLVYYAREIVMLFFQRGAFNPKATLLTSQALTFLSIGILAYVSHAVIIKVYYALRLKTILIVSTLIAMGVKFGASLLLVGHYFQKGLAMSTAAAGIVNIFILMVYLRHKIGKLNGTKLLVTFIQVSAAAGIGLLASHALFQLIVGQPLLLKMGLGITAFVIVYLVLAHIFRVHEIVSLVNKIRRGGHEK